MRTICCNLDSRRIGSACALLLAASALAQNKPVALSVDATDAPRKILHARLRIPAQPGPLTLLYPKWLPGEHSPSGPIADLVAVTMSAAGKPVPWRRAADDMFAFHLDVPAGADAVEVAVDFLLSPASGGFSAGASATAQLLDLSWNYIVLYPEGAKASELQYAASLRLPDGWKFGTALPLARKSGGVLEFSPVSLETLVDSPLIAGAHFRTVDLSPGATPPHVLHIVADSATALEVKPEDAGHFAHLTAETGALFGARHYRGYSFLLTLSEHVAHFGLEHHESSDNRAPERMLIDEDLRKTPVAAFGRTRIFWKTSLSMRPCSTVRRAGPGVRSLIPPSLRSCFTSPAPKAPPGGAALTFIARGT